MGVDIEERMREAFPLLFILRPLFCPPEGKPYKQYCMLGWHKHLFAASRNLCPITSVFCVQTNQDSLPMTQR